MKLSVSTQTLLDDLLKTHASIEEKYNIARGKLENARQAFENRQNETYYQKQAMLQTSRKKLDDERTRNRNKVIETFDDWRHESDERLQMLVTEQNKADNALKELRQWHPMADEINQADEQLRQLNLMEKENAAKQEATKSQITQIAAEYEMKEAEMKQGNKHPDVSRNVLKPTANKLSLKSPRLMICFLIWMVLFINGFMTMQTDGRTP